MADFSREERALLTAAVRRYVRKCEQDVRTARRKGLPAAMVARSAAREKSVRALHAKLGAQLDADKAVTVPESTRAEEG